LIPLRFFVENSYFKGITKVLLNVFGGFPAHYEAKRAYGLQQARSYMKTGQSVMIFPQGMRTRKKIAKSGIAMLAADPNTLLIPIFLNWKSRWCCEVHIGAAQVGGSIHSPEWLMDQVYRLSS
jgi:1-acyl-sn-glycerol-3-phosphate acyltransferase